MLSTVADTAGEDLMGQRLLQLPAGYALLFGRAELAPAEAVEPPTVGATCRLTGGAGGAVGGGAAPAGGVRAGSAPSGHAHVGGPLQQGRLLRAGGPRMQGAASVHGAVPPLQLGQTPNHCSKTTSWPRWRAVTTTDPLVAELGGKIKSGLNLS